MLILSADFETGKIICYNALNNNFDTKQKQDNRFLSNYNQNGQLSCAWTLFGKIELRIVFYS